MLCLKERKRVGWFIVNDIDRFSREVKDFHEVKTTLEKAGIQLVAASSPGDGEFMQGLKALLAQEDNRRRAERTKHGMVTAARAGKFQHRSPIGYTLINRGIKGNVVKLQPDDKLAPLINRAFLLIAQGKSQHEARMAITDLGFRTAEGV
jgi:DNA invertase Pin-like site-specific DNA recombinase